MIFQKFCKNRGIILVDIILALSLGAFLMTIFLEGQYSTQTLFNQAVLKNTLLLAASTTNYQLDNLSEYNLSDDLFCQSDFINQDIVGSYIYEIKNGLVSLPNGADISRVYNQDLNITISPIVLPINPLLPLTDIQVRNDIVYISADSNIAADPDIMIFDIHNRSHPVKLSEINTGPGIASFVISKNKILAAAASSAAQLHIISPNNSLDSLILQKKYQLPLPYATATPPYGSAISVWGNDVFLGTEKWAGDEFNIIDVSNIILPVKISGLEIGSQVNDIEIADSYAYVANSSDQQMKIFDISNIQHPSTLATFSPSGGNRQDGKTLTLFGDSLFLGRTSGGYDIVSDQELFSFASTSSTTLAIYQSLNIPGGVYGIVTDRFRAYLVTREIDKEFQIIKFHPEIYDLKSIDSESSDYQNNNSENYLINIEKTFSLPVAPQTITCDGDKLYILARSAPVIYEVNFR